MSAARDASALWERCLTTATHRPSPFTFFDGTIHMGPAVVLRGAPEAATYYGTLLAELEERTRTVHAVNLLAR